MNGFVNSGIYITSELAVNDQKAAKTACLSVGCMYTQPFDRLNCPVYAVSARPTLIISLNHLPKDLPVEVVPLEPVLPVVASFQVP